MYWMVTWQVVKSVAIKISVAQNSFKDKVSKEVERKQVCEISNPDYIELISEFTNIFDFLGIDFKVDADLGLLLLCLSLVKSVIVCYDRQVAIIVVKNDLFYIVDWLCRFIFGDRLVEDRVGIR